jgi:peptidoglycan L-alanyl-D-glutamate endopeptidase CwlK
MDVLREGSSGDDVRTIQQQLRDHGFPPGAVDGQFGSGTEAAVKAFQQSEGLLADGIVGPRTAAALGVATAVAPPPAAAPTVTLGIVAKMFPATPLDHINRNLPSVLRELTARDLTTKPIVLCALATIRAEVETFLPLEEGVSRFNTSPRGRPFDLYDFRKKDLGNQGPPDGASFRGRGFVQLTGRANYGHYGAMIGLGDQLINRPHDAADSDIAARLLAAFIASKEIPIKEALLRDDLAAARRLVNGGSNGLDRFTDAYRIGEKLLPG